MSRKSELRLNFYHQQTRSQLILEPQIAIYQAFGDEQKIRVRIEDENVWLTQKLIADLFDVDVRTVNEHLVNIYLERELDENSTVRSFRIVQKEASREVSRDIKHYNLDKILAVGYRVRSDRGTQFRQWATERLTLTARSKRF